MKPAPKWTMIIGGTIALAGPAVAIIGQMIGMARAHQTLGNSGTAGMDVLSSDIGFTLKAIYGGLSLGILGVIIFAIGLFISRGAKSPTIPPLLKNKP